MNVLGSSIFATKKRVVFSLCLIILVTASVIGLRPASAQFGGFSSSSCGGGGLSVTVEATPGGEVFVRANNKLSGGRVNVYFESLNDKNSCVKIGSATVNDKRWFKIGSLSKKYEKTPGTIIVAGKHLGADLYASAATVLVVSNDACNPKTNCSTNYQKHKGVLEPKTLSANSDFIKLQHATPIKGLSYSKVDYFDNGTFIYTSDTIEKVNRNYLRGGERIVTKVARFESGQTFTVTEKVDMGVDGDATLLVRSWFYRLRNDVKILIILSLLLLFGLGAAVAIRTIRKKKNFNASHGLQYIKRR